VSAAVREEFATALIGGANASGGWPYYDGKGSRLEPTCWAMLAHPPSAGRLDDVHWRYLLSRQRSDGLFSDQQDLPANLSWSALALLALSTLSTVPAGPRAKVVQAIVGAAGVRLPDSTVFKQNNQLRGWPWMPDTFSWVEPTSWCLVALKKAARLDPRFQEEAASRIAEGEQLLFDRSCESGGWNFGNANAFGTNLPAHIPTSAIGLLALQDKAGHPVVAKALAFVEQHWHQERSGIALALSILCLKIHGRATSAVEDALAEQWGQTRFLGNLAALGMASLALNDDLSRHNPLKVS